MCKALADGRIKQCNCINELHALICRSFILAARGVTAISFLHRLLYVWWVPSRDNLIKHSHFLQASCFDVWAKEKVHSLSFLLPELAFLQWIFKYFCNLFNAQLSASLSYFQKDIFTGRRGGELCGRLLVCLRETSLLVVSNIWFVFPVGAKQIRACFMSLIHSWLKFCLYGLVGSIASSKMVTSWHLCVSSWMSTYNNHGNLVCPLMSKEFKQ